jgi:hypothetical protein
MTISILRRILCVLPLAMLLLGCDVAPSAPNATAGPAGQPTTIMTSQPAPGGASAYPAAEPTGESTPPGPATPYPAPEPPTPYPAPTASS